MTQQQLSNLKIKNPRKPFTVKEVRHILAVVFTNRTQRANPYGGYNSWRLKSLMERISYYTCGEYKYCSNATVQAALKAEKFLSITKSNYTFYNVSRRDVRPLEKLLNS